MAQMPTQVEKLIHFLARDGARFREQVVDDFHRAAKTAGRRLALARGAGRTGARMKKGIAAQLFNVALSIHMVFSCQVKRSIMRSCVCRSFKSPATSRKRVASSTTFS